MVKLILFTKERIRDSWGEEDVEDIVRFERTYYTFNKARRAIPRLSERNPYAYIVVDGTEGKSRKPVCKYLHCTGERKPEDMDGGGAYL